MMPSPILVGDRVRLDLWLGQWEVWQVRPNIYQPGETEYHLRQGEDTRIVRQWWLNQHITHRE